MNKKLVIGNWKMNPMTSTEAKTISNKIMAVSSNLKQTETVVCPPFVFIPFCQSKNEIKNFSIGAQSVSLNKEGAHTGEVSVNMLKDLGIDYIILGHSEERERGDTNEIVSKKVQVTLEAGIKPIICVGEKTRDLEDGSHFDFLKEQIKETLANLPKKYSKDIIVAYEPVWAIGASEPMVPAQIYEMVIFIKKIISDIFDPNSAIKTTVLYGGSVNFQNAADIIKTGQVDGLLVGRESVNVAAFSELLKSVDSL